MKHYISSVTAACLVAGSAGAGALDRTGQSVDALFETGRYLEFSFSSVSPSLSGVSSTALGPARNSGDIAPSYRNFGGAYKADLNETLSYAVIIDQPFEAEVDYPLGTGYFAAGSNANFNSFALTGLLQYNMPSGFSVYGGLRLQSVEADAAISFAPFGLDYTAKADVHYGLGYVLGAAYEKPEIALRVSLTYNSEINHSVDTVETQRGLPDVNTSTDFNTPQSVNLAFQTGVAPGTLLFGGVRWVDWSNFDLDPALFQQLTNGSLLSYEDDIFTYTLGIGRKLNDTWSLAASLGYEETSGNFFTNLGPADGQESIGIAAIYTRDKIKITTGIRYIRIGDTVTRAGPVAPAANFDDNDAIAFGVKIGYSF